MPFTPFHFGPGALIKATAPRRFSFFTFCYAQIVTDLEVAYHILRSRVPLHGFFHTYLGAIIIAGFCAATVRPLHSLAAKFLNKSFYGGLVLNQVKPFIAISSALIGTLSHVVLDSVMHNDLRPLWPASEVNCLLGVVSVSNLHLLCTICGIVGIIWSGQILKAGITKPSK